MLSESSCILPWAFLHTPKFSLLSSKCTLSTCSASPLMSVSEETLKNPRDVIGETQREGQKTLKASKVS